jgi:type I restriction enzyme M protein
VLRRLDALLEQTKQDVLAMKKHLDAAQIANQEGALRGAAGQAFFNTAPTTLAELLGIAGGQRLRDIFIAYLDGFSPNVQEILTVSGQ